MSVNSSSHYHRYRRYFVGVGRLYKKKKARVYTGIIFSLLMIAFFGFFAIRPTLITISGLLKEIKDKKELVNQMDQKIDNLTNAQANYSQIKNNLYLVDQSLPQDPTLSVLIKQLEVLAQRSSVSLDSVRFSKTNLQGKVEKKEKQTVSFSLALSGNYQNLKQFLNSLDTLRRVISVESFALKSKMEGEIQLLALTINVQAHFLTRN